MKNTTKRIVEKFPNLEEKVLEMNGSGLVIVDDIQSLDSVECTFLKLALFFEDPKNAYFDLAFLYKELDNDWLEWALELITQFFQEDTYLIQKPSFMIIKDGSDYLNLTQFAQYLTDQGLRYDRQKVNLYYERGKIPQPDLWIGGTKYWSRNTATSYMKQEKKRL
jgi:protein involved in sex pheromone biosynthesis